MARYLVIVESPAKAKTISKFLGRNYAVKASMGHVRDLPKSQLGVDIEEGFTPHYITIRGKGEIVQELRQAARKAEKVFLAPDPDREGEAIAWHLQHLLGIDPQAKCRIEFNEITKQAVQEAVKDPRPIDMRRVNAQQARRVLDRLVGYSLSPLLWRKIKKGLSAGRVQSVAVRLICEREEEIRNFVPREYWTLDALLVRAGEGDEFSARLVQIGDSKAEISSQEEMEKVISALQGAEYVVEAVKKREKRRNPAPPFTTSTLQQEAYRKLGFSARKTMQIAQELYEGLDLGPEGTVGLVTYIRTDSVRLAESAQQEAREYIAAKFGGEYCPPSPPQYKSKGRIQNAHEAIRPTSVYREPEKIKEYLTRDQYRLYKLIWERFLASQMAPAVLDTTSVDIKAGDFLFRATGSVVKFPGFMKLYIEGRDAGTQEEGEDDEKLLPELTVGERLRLVRLNPEQHFTQPPPRYTDATLVKAMEEKGIGRPSTYAPVVETIQKRGYVRRVNKQFQPTELGFIVVDLLKKYFPDIIDVDFTAEMETQLDLIEEGEKDWVEVLEGFYRPFAETLAWAEEQIDRIEIEDEASEEKCPQCGRNLVYKTGRYGKFLACPAFPECRFTKPLEEKTGVACPECGAEILVKKSRRGRVFYGCSRYPECGFVSWDPPTERRCPQCGRVMVEKRSRSGGKYYQCIERECGYREAGKQKKDATSGNISESVVTEEVAYATGNQNLRFISNCRARR
ncbi:MAG: topoisomerase [Eubacteriales bacterium]|nr:topoisomerase [Eubacteriales bacterium]